MANPLRLLCSTICPELVSVSTTYFFFLIWHIGVQECVLVKLIPLAYNSFGTLNRVAYRLEQRKQTNSVYRFSSKFPWSCIFRLQHLLSPVRAVCDTPILAGAIYPHVHYDLTAIAENTAAYVGLMQG